MSYQNSAERNLKKMDKAREDNLFVSAKALAQKCLKNRAYNPTTVAVF
jgi:hypothetical protein